MFRQNADEFQAVKRSDHKCQRQQGQGHAEREMHECDHRHLGATDNQRSRSSMCRAGDGCARIGRRETESFMP